MQAWVGKMTTAERAILYGMRPWDATKSVYSGQDLYEYLRVRLESHLEPFHSPEDIRSNVSRRAACKREPRTVAFETSLTYTMLSSSM
jgi:hypothetical protein